MDDADRLTVVNVVASTRVAEELNLPDIAIQLNCEYEPEQFPGVVYRVKDPKLAILMFRSGRAVCTGGKNSENIYEGIERMIGDLRDAGITTWSLSEKTYTDDKGSTRHQWDESRSGDVEIEVQNMVATYALHFPEDYEKGAERDYPDIYVYVEKDGTIRIPTDEEVSARSDPKKWKPGDVGVRWMKENDPLAGMPRKLNLNNLTFHLPFDKVEYEPEQFPGLIYRLDYPRVVCLIFGSGKMVITGARAVDEIWDAVEIIKDELADLL